MDKEESILIEGQDLDNLQYGSQKMDLNPVNMSLGEITTRLFHGEAVYVELQPGDATRYQFYLIPCWSTLLRPTNLGPEEAKTFVVMAVLNLHRGTHLLNLLDDSLGAFYTLSEDKMNLWSKHLLASFMGRLRHTMQDKYGLNWYNNTPSQTLFPR